MIFLQKAVLFLFALLVFSSSYAEFKIISRSKWGAQDSQTQKLKTVDEKMYRFVTLHFSASLAFKDCGPSVLQKYQQTLMESQKTLDLPFQFIIDTCGNIYQGQALNSLPFHSGSTLEYQKDGRLTDNPNYQNIGVLMMGPSDSDISVAQQAASVWLIEQLRLQFEIESLMSIEGIIKHTEQCSLRYVANSVTKTVVTTKQKEAFINITNFFSKHLLIDRQKSCLN
jgi:N-acetylmuramoyl-L-alanine amidase